MKKKHLILLSSTILPMLIMLVGWIINDYYPFGTKSLMAIDFSQQFIDFYMAQKRAILSGDLSSFFYSFSKSIGGNNVGTWAYYLFSPFNIFYILFPKTMIVEAVFTIIILRYGLIGFSFAYFLIRRHKALDYHPALTILLAVAYTLNGYHVSYQMVPIFYDAMWMLPFILIGLEELLDGDRPYKYTLLLAFMIFIQFYMGYMICIFIVLYTIFYLVSKKGNRTWAEYSPFVFKQIWRLAIYSILAVAMTSIVFVPNVLNLFESKAAGANSLRFAWELQIDPLDILAKFNIGAFDNESWPFGPNLPNIYIGSLSLVGSILYFLSDKIKWRDKLGAAFVLLVFFISIVHEFTSKLWHMGQNPAGFFYRFSWILAFFLIYLAFHALKEASFKLYQFGIALALIGIMQYFVFSHDYTFLTDIQKYISMALFIMALVLVMFEKEQQKVVWTSLVLLTMAEIGANAVISQGRLNFTNAYKFQNAIEVIEEAIDPIRPGKDDFYRISKSFTRSKNDPDMFNYPGLTHFSSSLEVSTRDLLEKLGSNAVDASTTYIGTTLTDALFGVKYFIQSHPYDSGDPAINEKTYFFGNDVTRKDLAQPENLVSSTVRFDTYQIPYTLPIAFGVNEAVTQVELKKNQPVQNQEKILQALSNSDQEFLTLMAPNEVKMVNLEEVPDDLGRKMYRRTDGEEEGFLIWKFVPQTDASYYVSVPLDLSTREKDYGFFINGKSLDIRKKFVADQLFNIADRVLGQEQTLQVVVRNDETVDMTRLYLARFNRAEIEKWIQSKQAEGMEVSEWGNNFVKGSVEIGPDSNYLFTSIPYEDGWKVKVDGQQVETIKIWDALLAVPLSPGKHDLEFLYHPKGFVLGLGVSSLTILAFAFLYVMNKKNK